MLYTLKPNNEKQKKSSFYEEKSLVGLTPGDNPTNRRIDSFSNYLCEA